VVVVDLGAKSGEQVLGRHQQSEILCLSSTGPRHEEKKTHTFAKWIEWILTQASIPQCDGYIGGSCVHDIKSINDLLLLDTELLKLLLDESIDTRLHVELEFSIWNIAIVRKFELHKHYHLTGLT
jgi:hypothetical protein